MSNSETSALLRFTTYYEVRVMNMKKASKKKQTIDLLALSEKERKHVINHPVLGKQILSTVTEFQDILEIIYSHHERIDGNGYPNGLKKDEIPFLARVIAVADTYDAMRSERPYRRAMTKKEAVSELEKVKDHQLDEEIVETFIQVVTS